MSILRLADYCPFLLTLKKTKSPCKYGSAVAIYTVVSLSLFCMYVVLQIGEFLISEYEIGAAIMDYLIVDLCLCISVEKDILLTIVPCCEKK